MVRWYLISFFSIAALLPAAQYSFPPKSAPGATDSTITQANISTTICVPNYTTTVRPPDSWTNKLKQSLMVQFDLGGTLSGYELDHRLDIANGGAPKDPRNLWMQPWPEARLKDRLETFEHRQVCQGKISLKDSQAIFLGNFWTTYDKLAPEQGWPAR